jgi:hypothetical protein
VTSFLHSVFGLLRLRALIVVRALVPRLTYGIVLPPVFILIIGAGAPVERGLQIAFGGAKMISHCLAMAKNPRVVVSAERRFRSSCGIRTSARNPISPTTHPFSHLATKSTASSKLCKPRAN